MWRAQSAQRMWTAIAAESPSSQPPPFWVRATRAPSTWRGPASPRSCQVDSQIWAMPVAPIGWPLLSRPPLVLTGSSPSRRVRPEASSAGPLAGLGEADLLVDHQLGRGAGVVDLGAVDVLGADAGTLEGFLRRQGGRAASGSSRSWTLPERTTEARIRGPEDAAPARRLLAQQDDGRGTVGDRRAHQQGQRVDHDPAREHLLDAQLAAVLGARVEAAVVLVLDDDFGEVLGARPGDAACSCGSCRRRGP